MRDSYQCLGCDGFEEQGYPIGVLGFPSPMFSHLALMTFTFDAPSVTIYSNGSPYDTPEASAALKTVLARGCRLDRRSIKRLINNGAGPANGITIEFDDGENVTLGMLVHKPPTINRAEDLIRQLGLNTMPAASGGEVMVDPLFGETNLRGCFAAGDTANQAGDYRYGSR